MGQLINRRRTATQAPVESGDTYSSKVQYIYSDGKDYIDLDIVPDANTGISITFMPSVYNYKNSSDFYIIGLRNNSGNTRWCLGKSGVSKVAYYWGYGSYSYFGQQLEYGNKSILRLNYNNDKKASQIYTNGSTAYSTNLPLLSFTPSSKIRIFGASGNVSGDYLFGAGYLYEVQITQGSNIIMDLIPVRVQNKGYLYDTINKKLYGSPSNTFAIGQDYGN